MEIIIICLITFSSLLLLIKNFDLGVKVLLVLSTLLHKEVFSIYQWDLLPVRFFMLALGLYLVGDVVLTYYRKNHLKKYLKVLKDPLIFLLLLLWLVRTVSIYFSKNLSASLQLLAFYSTIIALGVVLFKKYVGQAEKLLDLVKFYIYTAFGLTIFGYVQLVLYTRFDYIVGALWNVPGHIPRIGSAFWDVNHFAALLALLLPVLGVLILLENIWKKRLIFALMFTAMTGLLLLTSSRTAWIIALVSFLSFITLRLIKRFGMKGIKYILVLMLLVLIPALREYSIKSSPFRAYIKSNFHYRLDSFAGHLMLLQGSYQIFEDHPVMGGGYGGFFEHFSQTDIAATFFGRDPAALNTRVPAHTIWGEALSETGIVGFSIMVLVVLVLLGTMLYGALNIEERRYQLLLSAIFSSTLGVFIAGIFYSYNAEFFWLVLFIYYLFSLSVVSERYSYKQVFDFITGSHRIYLFMIAFISFGLIFARLGANHLIPWDEAIYAKIAKNMVQRGEYIDLYWRRSIPWFEKPPLMMWLMSMFMSAFGFISLAARLPSALFGLGAVIMTYLLAKRLFGKMAAYISALSLITGIHFLYYSRAAMLDVAVTFFITLSIYLFVIAKEDKRFLFYILTGLSVGLAVMTKGVVGFLPLVIFSVYELYLLVIKQQSSLKRLVFPYTFLVVSMLAVALPWHLVMYLRYGREFIDTYLLYHVVDRATQAIEEKGQPFWWYYTVMKVSMRVWFIAFLAALPLFILKMLRKNKLYALLTMWFALVFLLFSVASSKIVWYIMPLYPAASIMVGVLFEQIYDRSSGFIPKLKEPLIMFLVLFLITVSYLMYLFYHRDMIYTSDLTGDEAELMRMKDNQLGTEDTLYIDRVPMPLVLYYTDSPYQIIDFDPSKGRVPPQAYDNRIIVLGKRGRYHEEILSYASPATVVSEQGDYMLWYHESQLNLDEERRDELKSELRKLQQTPLENAVRIRQLQNEISELESRISVFRPVE